MPKPTVTISEMKTRGKKLHLNGQINFNGGSGTAVFYLDPQPSGTPFGPFPLTLDGMDFAEVITLGIGKWKARIVATPDDGAEATIDTPADPTTLNYCECITLMPLVGGSKPVRPKEKTVTLDATTATAYRAAMDAAAPGSKRAAGANALIDAFGSRQVLEIFHNNKNIIRCEYEGSMTISSVDGSIKLHTSVAVPSDILLTADLSTGRATFLFKGGENYAAQMTGTVGRIASGDLLILDGNPVKGFSFESDFDFLLPLEVDQ